MNTTNIFSKEGENGYPRYWANINNKNADGEYIQAPITVRLSKSAEATFKKVARKTKNKKILGGRFELTDCWLKAVEGADENFLILFVNEMREEVDD